MDLLEPPLPPDADADTVKVRGSSHSRRRHDASTVRDVADRLLAGHTIEQVAADCGVNTRLVYTVRSGDHTSLTHQRRRALQAMYGVPRRRRSAAQRRRDGMAAQAIAQEGEEVVRQSVMSVLSELKAEVATMMREMAALQEMMRQAEGPMPVGLHPPAANTDGRPLRSWWDRLTAPWRV